MLSKVIKETKKAALELLCVIFPFIEIGKIGTEYLNNLSNQILLDKITTFVENQDSDFENWLKIACDFQKDSKEYNETVKLLIYTIDSFNDDKKIHIYANLMRAYKSKLINQDIFLRLSTIISVIFYDDLVYLKENIQKEITENAEENKILSLEASNLLNHNLIYCVNKDTWEAVGGHRVYRTTILGLEMVRCGIDYDNHDKYKNIDTEALAKISIDKLDNTKPTPTQIVDF